MAKIQGKEGTKSDDSFPQRGESRVGVGKSLRRGKWRVDEFSVGTRCVKAKENTHRHEKRGVSTEVPNCSETEGRVPR